MFNIYTKKQTTYSTQDVQIIEGECKNTESKCNFCRGKIYWNPTVINRGTKKRVPLSEPFYGQNSSPKPHRGCKYNLENFYTSLVILESDSPYIKATKTNKQKELLGVDKSGHSLTERLIRGRTPEEIQSYNEFIKKAVFQSFTGGK